MGVKSELIVNTQGIFAKNASMLKVLCAIVQEHVCGLMKRDTGSVTLRKSKF